MIQESARLWATVLLFGQIAFGTVYNATPATFPALLSSLQPGDTLNLSAGTYPHFTVANLNGSSEAWITITGPASGAPATIAGNSCCNTGEIRNSSYVAIKNLTIDSLGLDGIFGISANGGTGNLVHHILLEGNTLVGQGASQQTVAISTKTPTWGWTIRRNIITGAGTGLYLGNSDGTQPFVSGVIEDNLIQNTIGYNMQIKYQVARPAVAGMPTAPASTMIRNNVFIKNDQVSPDGDRPNVYLGGFPDSGAGSSDLYEVYGNFFYHNPREALLQAEGRVSLHDNVFVDGQYAAVVFDVNNAALKLAYVYNNTIYSRQQGIRFGSTPAQDDAVIGNLVFAATPIAGPAAHISNNILDGFDNAALYVKAPSVTLGSMDFFPLAGKAEGPALDLTPFSANTDYLLDFNGTQKTAAKSAVVFRGAYAGEGANPGWILQAGIKTLTAPPPPPPASLASLQCAPPAITHGQSIVCQVNLSSAASAPLSVAISGNGVLLIPSSVSVPAGSAAATFTAATSWASGGAVVYASYAGVTKSAAVQVYRLPRPASIACAASTITAGSSVDCTLSLQSAPLTTVSVTLKSSVPGLLVPPSVSVAAGSVSARFTTSAASFASYQMGTVTATLNGAASVTLTVQPAPPTSTPRFLLNGVAAEFSALANGATLRPAIAPAGSMMTLVRRGTGAVAFSPALGGDGVAFSRSGAQNMNTAFLVSQPGGLFDPDHGDLTFYLQSSYSFAERLALPSNYRFVFEIDDASRSQFYFYILAAQSRLIFGFHTAGTMSDGYYVPVGMEDSVFGKGVLAKFRLVWDGAFRSLYINDVNVTGAHAYTKTAPAWGAASSWTIGSRSMLTGGGYYALDDVMADFQIR